MSAALVLAFSAGMVATVNPCGFAMLPAYLSYFMGIRDEPTTRVGAMRSALVVGALVSLGFIGVFGVAGVILASASRTVAADWIPWLALVVGAGVGLLGIAMLFGYEPTIGVPKVGRARLGGGYGNVFGFGVSYAVASLSCTLPVFLSVVTTQMTARSVGRGVAVFGAYALGMSVVLMGVTVVLALGKQRLVNVLRSSARHVNRASGAILLIAGVWIVWFWSTAIGSGAATLAGSPGVRAIENLSQTLLNFIADNAAAVAAVLGAVVAGAVFVVVREPATSNRVDESEAVAIDDQGS